MTTSVLNNFVDRSGFSLLQGNHSFTANMNETFQFPSGTWSVHHVSINILSNSGAGNVNYSYTAIPDAAIGRELIGQGVSLWHETASGSPISLLTKSSSNHYYSFTDSKYVDDFTYDGSEINFEPGDHLLAKGFTGTGNLFISVTALRLV